MQPALPITYRRSLTGLILILLAGAFVSGILFWGAFQLAATPGVVPATVDLINLVALIAILVTLLAAFVYDSAKIVLSQQGIEIQQRVTLFWMTNASCEWRDIEDVTVTKAGIVRSLFDTGDILIQTAGTQTNLGLTWLDNPQAIADVIDQYQSQLG